MTPRSVRRAAERKAAKRARKPQPFCPEPEAELPGSSAAASIQDNQDYQPRLLTEARLAANRANAQLSTGPVTVEGKTKSSIDAVTTALTGRTVLLPGDDAARYQAHVQAFVKELKPYGPRECEITQSLADTAWRLNRITTLEMAIFAHGRLEFEALVVDALPEARPALLDMHTFLAYDRQLRNLYTQESRLHSRHLKQSAELKEPQPERNEEESRQYEDAAKLYLAAKKDRKPFHPDEHGFEFSIEDVEAYLEGVRAAAIARETLRSQLQATAN